MSTENTSTARRSFVVRAWFAAVFASEALALVLALATLIAFFAPLTWLGETIAHWRLVIAVLLFATGALPYVVRHDRRLVLILTFALINCWQVAPQFQDRRILDGVKALRVFHANVDIANHDTARVARAIHGADADVVVLQEVGTRWLTDLAPTLAEYPHRFESPRDDPFGIAVYSRFELQDAELLVLSERATPAITARIAAPTGTITLFATHPRPPLDPWSQNLRNVHLDGLSARVLQTIGPKIVVGDLNTSPLAASFRRFVAESGLVDGAQGFGWHSTWPAALGKPLRIRLDHVLHSRDLGVAHFAVGPRIGSDHLPIVVDLTRLRTAP